MLFPVVCGLLLLSLIVFVGICWCLSFDIDAFVVLVVCCWLSLCVAVQCSRVRLCWCMLLLLFVGCGVSLLCVVHMFAC